jgi:hypothetical protein
MLTPIEDIGTRAENRVFAALKNLSSPWQVFPTVEWRLLRGEGEVVGEADLVVFHPHYGLVVFEIKAGAVDVREGEWFYASGRSMKQSPFSQARRNRYALTDKLIQRLGKSAFEALTLTHAVWFPDVHWSGPMPGTEAATRAFLFDRDALAKPEKYLLQLFRAVTATPLAWSASQQKAVKEILAPDCHLLVPMVVQLDETLADLQQATEQQITILRMLRTQSRLLVEGCAGSGKTLLAICLAREHAALGKSVLLTCFNRNLAEYLSDILADVPAVTVMNFHELVRTRVLAAGLSFQVPEDLQQRIKFFRDDCPELLINAVELLGEGFDTLIVDEGADFTSTWWVALEVLGRQDFSWYCFFDRQQAIYQDDNAWVPPFNAAPFVLDTNLRNTRPIGEQAAKWGQVSLPNAFRIEEGLLPEVQYSLNFTLMGEQLKQLLRNLINRERIAPERIVVLSPYRHTNQKSTWSIGLSEITISTQMHKAIAGCVRVGAIQGFKGLEADVIILVGLDNQATSHPEWLYVGASRAKVALYALFLESTLH